MQNATFRAVFHAVPRHRLFFFGNSNFDMEIHRIVKKERNWVSWPPQNKISRPKDKGLWGRTRHALQLRQKKNADCLFPKQSAFPFFALQDGLEPTTP